PVITIEKLVYTLTVSVRRRRRPEEAEAEILDAAESLLRERTPDELSVSSVMAATTLTCNAFYVYFSDRYELLARLVERLRADAAEVLAEGGEEDAAADRLRAATALLHGVRDLRLGLEHLVGIQVLELLP